MEKEKRYYMCKAKPVDVEGVECGYQLGATRNGKEYARVVLEILDGPRKGEAIVWDGWLTTQGAIDKTLDGLRLLGYDKSKGNIVDGQTQALTKVVSVVTEMDGGQEKVAWINDPAGRYKVGKDQRIAGAAAERLLARINGTPVAATTSFDDDDDSQLNF